MNFNASKLFFRASFTELVKRKFADIKRRDRAVFVRVRHQVDKILRAPELGKPLRYQFKSCRRLHVGSFVLIYEIRINSREIHFLEFGHHDKIYKK